MEYSEESCKRQFLYREQFKRKTQNKAEKHEAKCRADTERNILTVANSPHKVSLEKFEACGALRLTIVTINFKPNSTPGQINTNTQYY